MLIEVLDEVGWDSDGLIGRLKKREDGAQVEFSKIEQTKRFPSLNHMRSVYTQKAEEVATNR